MSDPGTRERSEVGMEHDTDTRHRATDQAPLGPSVSTIRDLFRVEARELLAGMGQRLGQRSRHAATPSRGRRRSRSFRT